MMIVSFFEGIQDRYILFDLIILAISLFRCDEDESQYASLSLVVKVYNVFYTKYNTNNIIPYK